MSNIILPKNFLNFWFDAVEWVRVKKKPKATLLFVDFSKGFDSIHRRKMEQILLTHGLPKETVAAIKSRKLKFIHQMETQTLTL